MNTLLSKTTGQDALTDSYERLRHGKAKSTRPFDGSIDIRPPVGGFDSSRYSTTRVRARLNGTARRRWQTSRCSGYCAATNRAKAWMAARRAVRLAALL